MRAIKRFLLIITCTALSMMSGCVLNPTYQPDFGFPVGEGDPIQGKTTFIHSQCNMCHTVEGADIPKNQMTIGIQFELGGNYTKSYGELLTAIINPDHIISEQYQDQTRTEGLVPVNSPMPRIDALTVGELLDLIAFIEQSYY